MKEPKKGEKNTRDDGKEYSQDENYICIEHTNKEAWVL